MSSASGPRFWRLLSFRLTLWYGGVLAMSELLCFVISYFVIVLAMRERTDADLRREAAGCADALKTGGLPALVSRMNNEARGTGTNDIFFLVYDSKGKPIASSDLSTWWDMVVPPPNATDFKSQAAQLQDAFGTGHHQKLRVLTQSTDHGFTLRIGTTVQDDARVIDQARRVVSLVMICMLGVAIAVGLLLAKRALAGVQQVTNTAKEISRGAMGRRVPTSGSDDEIDQLALTVNRMLERIDLLVKGMKETNDNIAHELRSPITRIRGLAEMTFTRNSSIEAYQDMAGNTVEECDRVLGMINTMLDIAEAEAGVMNLKMAPLDLAPLLRNLCELYEPVISEKEIALALSVSEPTMVLGDVHKLQRAFANLLDNAVKYTSRAGQITLSATAVGRFFEVAMHNTGDGISAEALPNIFKRFYRVDKSRSEPGNGLGLSLAQAIVRAHGGDISATSVVGQYAEFRLNLPVSEPVSQPVA